MQRLSQLCFFVFLFSTSQVALGQDCSQAGRDTTLCGMSIRLSGNPAPGQWSHICREDSALASIFNSGSRGIISVTRCGTYTFAYKAEGCDNTDTVHVTFLDPAFQRTDIQYEINLGYNTVECHTATSDTCGNRRVIQGQFPPVPQWDFQINGICSGTRTVVQTNGVDSSACLANAISIQPEPFSVKGERHWAPTQNVLIRLNQDGRVEQNIFVSFLQILTNSLENEFRDSCEINVECDAYIHQCIDTLYDTTYLSIPVRIGGHWTFIGQGGAVGLDTSDRVTIQSSPYSLLVKPSPNYYGPDPIVFELWKLENDKRVNIDTALQADVYWEEDWIYDTIMRVVPKYYRDTSCLNCGYIDRIYGAFEIPPIPVISTCHTLLLHFTPVPLINLPKDTALCDDDIVILDAGVFKDYKWENGIDSRYRSVVNPGSYSVTVTAFNGCVDSATTRVRQAAPPSIEIVLTDSSSTCIGEEVDIEVHTPELSLIRWSTGDTTAAISLRIQAQTTLGVEVIDTNGCLARDTLSITGLNAQFQIDAGPNLTLNCRDLELQPTPDSLTTTRMNDFYWEGPGIDSIKQLDSFPALDTSGLFVLSILDTATGCYARDTLLVVWDTFAPEPLDIEDMTLNCLRDSLVIEVRENLDSSLILTWSGPGIDSFELNARTVTLRDSGWYYAELCNPDNLCCTLDSFRIITYRFMPVANAGEDKTIRCMDPFVWIGDTTSIQSPYTAARWEGPGLAGTTDSIRVQAQQGGVYRLILTDSLSHCLSTDTVRVFASDILPVADAGPDLTLGCDHPEVTLSAGESTFPLYGRFQWSGPDIDASNHNDTLVTVKTAGTYILTIEDTLSGCVAMDTVIVTGKVAVPRVEAGRDKILTCTTPNTQLGGIILNPNQTQVVEWKGPGIDTNNQSVPQPTVTQPGKYYFTVTDTTSNCMGVDSVEVTGLFNPATVSAGEDKSINCQNSEVRLIGKIKNLSPKASFIWSGPGVTSTNQNNLTITVDTIGMYILMTSYPHPMCNRSDTVIVTVDTLPPRIALPASVTLDCASNQAVVKAVPEDTTQIRQLIWQSTHGFEYLVEPYEIITQSPDTLRLFWIGNNGCSQTQTIFVEDWNRFEIQLSGQSSCPNTPSGSLRIEVTPPQHGPYQYSLDSLNFSSDSLLRNLPADTYKVYVRSKEGCTLSRSIAIDSLPRTTFTVETTPSCDVPPTGQIILSPNPKTPGNQYYLAYDGDTLIQSTAQFDSLPGNRTYTVVVQDINGCLYPDEAFVEEAANFTLSPLDTIFYCTEAFITLDAEEEDTPADVRYDWGTTNDTTSTRTVSASVNEYAVRVSNACTTQEKLFVLLTKHLDIDTIGQIPLAFTPNGDNNNDRFGLIITEADASSITRYNIRVYNRWGEVIFEADRPDMKWDGTFNGEPQPTGNYLYVIAFTLEGCGNAPVQNKALKGDVLLIR